MARFRRLIVPGTSASTARAGGRFDGASRAPRFHGHRHGRRRLAFAAVVALAVSLAAPGVAAAAPPSTTDARTPNFGPNVTIFDAGTPVAEIQAKADAIYAQQVGNEMGAARYALLFEPGVYGTAVPQPAGSRA